MSARKWRAAAPRSGICSPPGPTSPPGMCEATVTLRLLTRPCLRAHQVCSVRPLHASHSPSPPTHASPQLPSQGGLPQADAAPPCTWALAAPPPYLDDVSKVLPRNPVVGLDEDLSEDRLPNRVIFGIELVKAMEGVPVLGEEGRPKSPLTPGPHTGPAPQPLYHWDGPRAHRACPHSGRRQ